MGFLFKKPRLKEKDEDNPVWKELRTFREEQKRKVSGEPQKRDIPSRKAEDGSNEPVLPPIEPLKFRCTSCGTVYPESWNRCPKCGGEVVPVKPEEKLEEKNLDVLPPGQKMPSPSSAELMAPVKTVKKVKKIKKKTKVSQAKEKKETRISPLVKNGLGTVSSRFSSREMEREKDISKEDFMDSSENDTLFDSIFKTDPLLDGVGKEDTALGWRNASVSSLNTMVRSHHPSSIEVKEILHQLIHTGEENQGNENTLVCSNCGFVQPPGDWDFCMKCGTPLKKH